MGECVKVAGFSERMPITRRAQLQAYGVWAGSPVWVLQHAPVTIIRVEHCELALERELARQIEIEPEIKLQ
jgi:Fe2+ transport system protein FeoA